ncbi:MAG: GTP cyclohydrolase I [Paraclostridium sp.]
MQKYVEMLKGLLICEVSKLADLAQSTLEKRDAYLENKAANFKHKFETIENATLATLVAIGEDPTREGLIATPFRRAKMLLGETMSGYGEDLVKIAASASFEDCESGNIVLVKNIAFFSNCEHHMVPFFGKAHVAYVPNGKVLGLSKIPRVVKMASKKLQLQEGLGQEIAEAIQAASNAKAVVVIIDSEKHLCVSMRGVEDTDSNTVTIATAGPKHGWEVSKNELVDTVFKMLGR